MPRTIQPRAPHHRTSTLTGAQFKALREQLGLSVRDLARLLGLTETTIRMIEAPATKQHASRQTEQMLRWLCDPVILAHVKRLEGQNTNG